MRAQEDERDWLWPVTAVLVTIAACVALISLSGCHLGGGRSLTAGVSVMRDPITGELYPVLNTGIVPALTHNEDQWQRAFGRRTGDIEQIANLRAEAGAHQRARQEAEESKRALEARLAALSGVHEEVVRTLTADRDRWQELAEESDFRFVVREIFSAEWNTTKAVVIPLLGVLVVLGIWLRRRKSGQAEGNSG